MCKSGKINFVGQSRSLSTYIRSIDREGSFTAQDNSLPVSKDEYKKLVVRRDKIMRLSSKTVKVKKLKGGE